MQGLVLFDIDGTLLRAGDRLHQRAFVEALQAVYDVPASLDGVPLAGMLDSQIARMALEYHGISHDDIDRGMPRLMQLMEIRYREWIVDDERRSWVLPGVISLAERLMPDYALAVMTGNAQGVARAKLESAGIADLFRIGAYGDSAVHRHQLVDVAAQQARATHGRAFRSDEAIIVGDTPRDIEAARGAGALVLAVATGRFSVEDLKEHEPDLVFEDLTDVDAIQRSIALALSDGPFRSAE